MIKSPKKVIAVDNDDVIFGLVESILTYHNFSFKTKYKFKDQLVFDLKNTFNCSEEETIDRIFNFYKSDYLLNTKPMPGALTALQKLKIEYDLVLVTARPIFTKKVTLQALNKHFPDIFKAIHLTNGFSKTGPKKLKSEVCKEAGAVLLIDDAMHNAEDCAEHGIPVILYDRPWNLSVKQNQLKGKPIYRAKNWPEVLKIIKTLNL